MPVFGLQIAISIFPKDLEINTSRHGKIVGGVKESVREDMVSKAVKLQDFLMANVMTEVSQIMIEIVQKRPEDPLMMMADRLDEIAAERERVARDKAEKRFYDLLARAEAGEIMYEDGKW